MKRVYLLLLALLVAFVAPNVYALPIGKADNNLNIKENYNDTAFIAGNSVNVDSKIDGLGFVAGNSVTVQGAADYGFIAGNSVNISSYSTKDLFVAGSNITITNSYVRNIYAAASVINIKGNASTVYVVGDDITLEGDFENLIVAADKFNFKGSVTGTLKINESVKENIDSNATIANKETYKDEVNFDKGDAAKAFFVSNIIAKLIAKVMHVINILIIGLIFVGLFKKTNNKIKDMKVDVGFVFAKFGIGLLLLIAVPIISIILMFTGVASALGLISIVLYCLTLYLSEIVGTMYIARKIFPTMNSVLAYIIVLFVLSLVSLIPFLGGLVSFFLLCMSLGLIFDLIKSEIKGK